MPEFSEKGPKKITSEVARTHFLKAFEELEIDVRVTRLKDFFTSRPNVGHFGFNKQEPFSLLDYAEAQMLFDVEEGATEDSELKKENHEAFLEKYKKEVLGDLVWLIDNGFLETVGKDMYRLTEDGRGIVSLKH